MNLLPIGFLSLTLLSLADGFLLKSGGGFGGISGIFGILLILILLVNLGKRTNGATCPANYTQTPNDPTSCIRFFSSPMKSFIDAFTACQNEGAHLLTLSTASFPIIQEFARNKSGVCNYWVDTHETADGSWFDINQNPTDVTPGLFFQDPTNGAGNDCGVMGSEDNYFLFGTVCTQMQCYICQKDF
ncbi:hypothetical protein ACJMK2_003950 [Sinanodonta woodiana]|uniref:C-type lectin domain-containing protein n=1 Tax=Sinanodonta woodiana TaxID=1069815 RepID=A0ABD3Y2J7_SINWO